MCPSIKNARFAMPSVLRLAQTAGAAGAGWLSGLLSVECGMDP